MLVALAESGSAQLVGPLPAAAGRGGRCAAAPGARAARGAKAGPAARRGRRRRRRSWSAPARRDLLAGEVELARRAEAAVRRGAVRRAPGVGAQRGAPGARASGWRPSGRPPSSCGARCWWSRRRCCGRAGWRARSGRWSTPTARRATRDIDPTPVRRRLVRVHVRDDVRRRRPRPPARRARACCCAGRAPRAWSALRPLWPFPVAGGLAAAAFGLLYGEAFGPTGIVPTLWLAPLDEPVRLLAVAVGDRCAAAGRQLRRWASSTAGARAARARRCSRRRGSPGSRCSPAPGCSALGVYLGVAAPYVAGGVAVVVAGMALLFAGFAAEAGVAGAGDRRRRSSRCSTRSCASAPT